MNNIWFTADTHFGHANIIKYCQRPFFNAEEQSIYALAHQANATEADTATWRRLKLSKTSLHQHDEALIDNWNRHVAPDDAIYHLGDFCLGNKRYTHELLDRLNGRIHLVLGNHDKSALQVKERFIWVKDYHELSVADPEAHRGQRFVVLFHYALRIWNASHYGTWSLYGHSHNELPDDPQALSIDVGVDAVAARLGGADPQPHYRPLSYAEVKTVMASKLWQPPKLSR